MKRLAALAAGAVLLAACGGDDDDDDRASEETEAELATSIDAVPTTATATAPTTTAAEGVAFTSPQGDFTITFPDEPELTAQDAPLPDGRTVTVEIHGVASGSQFVGVGRSEYPDDLVLDPPLALQGAQDMAISNVGGTLIDDAEIELQGRPGREFRAAVSNGGVDGTALQRVYLDGQISYTVIAVGTGELSFDDPDLVAFFDSFAFTA